MSAQIHQASMVSGRSLVFMATVALHVGAIAALMAWKISEANSKHPVDSMVLSWLDEPPRPKETVKPIEPIDRNVSRKLTQIPVPNPAVPLDPDSLLEEPLLGDLVHADPQVAGSSDPDLPLAVPDTPLRFRAVRPSDDYYPPNAVRLEQQGTVIVRACVDAAGKLAGEPRVVTGSRFPLLDGAAVAWAGEALRFTAATKGGTAVGACKDFRVNFKLH